MLLRRPGEYRYSLSSLHDAPVRDRRPGLELERHAVAHPELFVNRHAVSSFAASRSSVPARGRGGDALRFLAAREQVG